MFKKDKHKVHESSTIDINLLKAFTWYNNDEHGQDFQKTSHDCRSFGVRNVLC